MPWSTSTILNLAFITKHRSNPSGRPIITSSAASGNDFANSKTTKMADHDVSHYFVLNRARSRKNKRPAIPPMSPPMDGLDQGIGSSSRTVPSATDFQKRPKLAIKTFFTISEHTEELATRPTTPKQKFDPIRAFRESFLSKPTGNGTITRNGQGNGNTGNGHTSSWKGKEKEIIDVPNEERRRIKKSKVSEKAREIREWMKGKSGSEIHRSDSFADIIPGNGESSTAKPRQSIEGSRDLFKGRHTIQPAPYGPKPGQTYEIIRREVIEENSEKTVELSTWREQQKEKTRPFDENQEKISVYYLNADDYANEDEFGNQAGARFEEVVIEEPDIPQTTSPRSAMSRADGEDSQDLRNFKKSNSRQYKNSEEITPRSYPHKSTGHNDSERRLESLKNYSNPEPVDSKFLEHEILYSSTPLEKHRQISHSRGHSFSSTRVEKELPKFPSSHQNGSNLGSANSQSTIDFECVLRSCEPSLFHIAPMLRSLGILRVEHLRAVAKLTPTTRDREVKEAALKLGITVMEWAILLDKVFLLAA